MISYRHQMHCLNGLLRIILHKAEQCICLSIYHLRRGPSYLCLAGAQSRALALPGHTETSLLLSLSQRSLSIIWWGTECPTSQHTSLSCCCSLIKFKLQTLINSFNWKLPRYRSLNIDFNYISTPQLLHQLWIQWDDEKLFLIFMKKNNRKCKLRHSFLTFFWYLLEISM